MEKKKIFIKVCVAIVILLVYAAMFAISPFTGLSAMLFSVLGYYVGHFVAIYSEFFKIQKDFLDKFLENKEDFFKGKIVTFTTDDNTGELTVRTVEVPAPEHKSVIEVINEGNKQVAEEQLEKEINKRKGRKKKPVTENS